MNRRSFLKLLRNAIGVIVATAIPVKLLAKEETFVDILLDEEPVVDIDALAVRRGNNA